MGRAWSKSFSRRRFPLCFMLIAIFLGERANAQVKLEASAPAQTSFCRSMTRQINKFESNDDRSDMFTTLKYPGLSWPPWVNINPKNQLDLIKKILFWPFSQDQNSSNPNHKSPPFRMSEFYLHQWNTMAKPTTLEENSLGLLQMQTTTLQFNNLAAGNPAITGQFIRFRVLKDMHRRNVAQNLNRAIMDPQDWQYSIGLTIDGYEREIPLGEGSLVYKGQLGELNQRLVIFDGSSPTNILVSLLYVGQLDSSNSEYQLPGAIPMCAMYHSLER